MHYIVSALLTALILATVQSRQYSYSPAAGSGSGSGYSLTGEGKITAIRVWEYRSYSPYISGLQIRFGGIWSERVGNRYNAPLELELYENEAIIQISGKYSHYIQSLVFITNMGRSLIAGQPSGHSFNMYPKHKDAELLFVSGQVHGGLTTIAAHWGVNKNSSKGESHNGL